MGSAAKAAAICRARGESANFDVKGEDDRVTGGREVEVAVEVEVEIDEEIGISIDCVTPPRGDSIMLLIDTVLPLPLLLLLFSGSSILVSGTSELSFEVGMIDVRAGVMLSVLPRDKKIFDSVINKADKDSDDAPIDFTGNKIVTEADVGSERREGWERREGSDRREGSEMVLLSMLVTVEISPFVSIFLSSVPTYNNLFASKSIVRSLSAGIEDEVREETGTETGSEDVTAV